MASEVAKYLGRKGGVARWRGVSAKERAAWMRKVVAARWAKRAKAQG